MTCKPDCTECSRKPCDLCQKRARYAGIFVAVAANGCADFSAEFLSKFVCGHCIPTHNPAIDVSDDHTQVWEVGSSGWLKPIECMDCGESIDVEIGAVEDET
jgi:hypothetical protein